ncbi:MAG TPA: GNAT family N-acetyltransferase [Chitinophagaceae bacterium]|nr:GNAT family N-acetyltransferase [Chitinophagaceae bacterium]
MRKTDFIVRSMQPGDIVYAMKLSNAEGWNQTENDWKLLIESPQNVCLVAEYNKKIIGTTTAMNYANQIAWIGMVLVAKESRGQGVSKLLLTNILKKLESFESIKLDATPAGKQVYQKFDFKDEYLITRVVTGSMTNLSFEDDTTLAESIRLKDIEEIVALDEHVFGTNRRQLIESLINRYPHKAWLLKRNNSIAGFALGRDGNKYHHVGPVCGSTINDVKMLIRRALKELIYQPVVIDVLSEKEDLISWLHSIGFTMQRHFVRMYKKENLFPGIVNKQYLICGPEFG